MRPLKQTLEISNAGEASGGILMSKPKYSMEERVKAG